MAVFLLCIHIYFVVQLSAYLKNTYADRPCSDVTILSYAFYAVTKILQFCELVVEARHMLEGCREGKQKNLSEDHRSEMNSKSFLPTKHASLWQGCCFLLDFRLCS